MSTNTTKPKVFIPDHNTLNDPEILAMVQSMYSRSDMGIEERLQDLNEGDADLKQSKIKQSLNTFYLNYGHSSIADCANVPVFIEGVSMLAAKALQDNPLYNGQERSTRYQDFSTVPFYADSEFSKQTGEKWRALYKAYLPKIEAWVVAEYSPKRDLILKAESPVDRTPEEHLASCTKRDVMWAKTCKAIAFDIARGLLPCGATTSLSMYMSLRKYRDHLTSLSGHPLAEVRRLALQINDELYARYPNTFKPIRDVVDVKNDFYMLRKVYDAKSHTTVVDYVKLGGSSELPARYLANTDHLEWFGIQGGIDFGSYRDLQRHRNGPNQMPLVSASNGDINFFYKKILKEVDFELFQQVLDIYDQLIASSNIHSNSIVELQYAHPMMTQVPVGMFWSLGQLKYVIALRSKTSVHPTLRAWCHSLYFQLSDCTQRQIDLDIRGDYINSDRGSQDLIRRTETQPQ